MISIERKYPKKLLILESILRRLPQDNPEYEKYLRQYKIAKHGYEGELRVDREWKDIQLELKHFLLHSYQTINDHGTTHQIDTIFLSCQFVLLLEIKNISGTLVFDEDKHQFLRTQVDNTIESFYNPIDQIERHAILIKTIMNKMDLYIPIEIAIVIANSATIIGVKPRDTLIFHVSGLRSKVNKLILKHPKPRITLEQLVSFKETLLEMYCDVELLPKFEKSNLVKGAICSNCNSSVPMKYTRGVFCCNRCNFTSRNAIFESLHDYRLLFDEWITNNRVRQFFGIESVYSANKLLKRANLVSYGNNRGRKYLIPNDILEKSR